MLRIPPHLVLTTTLVIMLFAGEVSSKEKIHWDYSGATGPEHWGELTQDYSLCSSGKNQSPVNLVAALDAELPPLDMRYMVEPVAVVNTGHSIQLNFKDGGSLTVDGQEYALLQIHFHSPSENTIDGQSFPLEGHLVHADSQGHLAVVAVFYDESMEHRAVERALLALPLEHGKQQQLSGIGVAEDFLPPEHGYYRFNGSLTTPPCTEGVTWLVMKTVAHVDTDQVSRILHALGGPNNRPIQPINARIIVK